MGKIIDIVDLYKNFEDKQVLKGVSMSIEEGEVMTLIGASGSGKSVLLRLIIGLISPDRGKIFFHGKDTTNYTEEDFVEVRRQVAMLFQGGALFDSLSILDNVCYPLREHTDLPEKEIIKRAKEQIKALGLEGTEDLSPADLSGGMQRRVGIARSIVLQPEVILFDEPTTGLDPANTRNICEIIKFLNSERNITCLVVTHDMATALKITDRMAMLNEGRIAILGTKDEIVRSNDPLVKGFITGESLGAK